MRNAGFDLVSVHSDVRFCGVDGKEKRADKAARLRSCLKAEQR